MSLSRPSPHTVVLEHATVRRRFDGSEPDAAIAIRDGRVFAVGQSESIAALVGDRAQHIDLGGRAVIPAFTDSHTHFHRHAVLQRVFLDFQTIMPASIDAVLELVRRRAAETQIGGWIQGDGLTAQRLQEGRLPDRHEVDSAASDHPVVLRGIGKHVVVANSLALKLAGIDRDTLDPPGGRIERDERGEPTGVLHERAKLRLDASRPDTVVPRVSREERLAALRDGVRALHRLGITTIHEMVRDPQEAGDLAALRQLGELDVRVRVYYRVYETAFSLDWLRLLGVRGGLGDDWYRISGVKVSIDGMCIFQNAAVYEHYPADDANHGLLRIEEGDLDRLVAEAHAAGLGIAVHAVGVRAVDTALHAFERAGPPGPWRHRLEHAYLDVDDDRLRRIRDLGLFLSTQPAFTVSYAKEWAEIFGDERRARMMPLRRAYDLGVPLLLNSDVPCGPLDPLETIRAAATHSGKGGVLEREQGLPLPAAWAAMTSTPSAAIGEPHAGHLDVGAVADLIVLDEDPLEPGFNLEAARVRATMIDGRFVFDEIGVDD